MTSLTSIVETCTAAIAAVTPQNLSAGTFVDARRILEGVDVDKGIDQYLASLPAKPEDETHLPEWEALMHKKASELNHTANQFNKELSRLKEMQVALNVPQLEELIHVAQNIIRPVYNFSSQLSV